jgi:hypothetical protein
MNLLNTIALPNQHVAHGQDYIAVYADGVVSTYRKNRTDNTVDLQPVTYTVPGVLHMRMSQNGNIVAVQTATQTIRLQNGTQTPFNNVGKFDIANTGHLIIVDAVNGAVQVITNSTTNLTTAVTDDDRVVCGRQGYMVYNTARTLLGAKFADVTFTNTPSAKEIVFALHVKDDKYAVFYKDGTATYDGITRTITGPTAGFREAGSHILSTDYKQDFYTQRFNPLSDPKFLRTFNFVAPPLATVAQWAALKLLASGGSFSTAGFDSKNSLAIANSAGMTVVSDSPYGSSGNALNFNGSTSFLQTADSADIRLANADFTIELFVKIQSGASATIGILNKGGIVGGAFAEFSVYADRDSKQFGFAASLNGTTYGVGGTLWGNLEFNTWTHIAITRKVNVWRCFQNGKLQAKFNVAGSIYSATGRGLQIGHWRNGDFNAGALALQLSGRVHGLTINNYAKYTSNFVVDTIPLVQEPAQGGIPGASSPIIGDTSYGYYGGFDPATFVTGDALATMVGLTAGVSINSDTPWFKFASNGKILLVPRLPIRSHISWPQIYAAGLVYGLDSGIGPFPLPSDATVLQNKRVTISGHVYKVRLLTGGNADPYPSGEFNVNNPANALDSEYTKLVQRTWAQDPNGSTWDSFDMEELGSVNGTHLTWCQESHPYGPPNRVHRGISGPAGMGSTDGNYTDVGGYIFVWRPVLEYVGPA